MSDIASQTAAYGLCGEQRAVQQNMDEVAENEIVSVAAGYDEFHEYLTEIIGQDLIAPNAPSNTIVPV